jgi:hypothetical protein
MHFRATVLEVLTLYTRPLESNEQVWSLDEKTSLQPLRTFSIAVA